MKGIILFTLLFTASNLCHGQQAFEKRLDKFNVQTIEVSGHTFSVGDTLTFTVGSLPNGEFVSTQLSPGVFLLANSIPPHLPAGYINYKFIVEKIRYSTDELNSFTTLVFYIDKKTPVWVDANIAILKKEIILK